MVYTGSMPDESSRSDTFPSLLVLGLLIAVGCGVYFFLVAMPARTRQRRAWELATACSGLMDLVAAEAHYRLHDQDRNKISDYWTGDVAGLFKYGRIDRGLAEADVHPLVPLVPVPVPKNGFLFMALEADETPAPPESYRQETDPKSGKVHHPTKFGFLVFPADDAEGPYMYIVNESGKVFHAPRERPRPKNYPSPQELSSWSPGP